MGLPAIKFNRILTLAAIMAAATLGGCAKKTGPLITPPVDNPTEGWGLRKLEPSEYPDMKLAWRSRDGLVQAIDKSLQFLNGKSSNKWYPSKNPGDTITHDQIQATLLDIKDMMNRNISEDEFQSNILGRYDVYTSVGYDGNGDVWFTGYFTPEYQGSRVQTSEFRFPIYRRPDDLKTDPATGTVIGGEYATRRDLLQSGKLKGLELFWFRKPIEPFMIQVQGSALIRLPDNSTVKVGYAGSNDRKHTGLGTLLRDEGKIDPKHVSLPAVMAYYDAHPDELETDVLKDDRFTFLKEYTTAAELREWPTGSIGVQVTPSRSIATDKDVFPRAALTFLNVDKASYGGQMLPYQGFMLDQDRGGAIRAAGRADIYFGEGPVAGELAGQEFAQGRLYYIFLKPQYVHTTPVARATPAATTNPPRITTTPPRTAATPVRTPTPTPTARPTTSDPMFPGAVH